VRVVGVLDGFDSLMSDEFAPASACVRTRHCRCVLTQDDRPGKRCTVMTGRGRWSTERP
jgi:hypothetical protein